MASKFEIYQSEKSGEYYFRLKSANGQVVLSSEGYKDKSSAKNGVESVKKHAGLEANYEKKLASNGKPFFNLKAKNGQVIGKSQMYSSEAACNAGIDAVGRAAEGAGTVDLSVK